MPKHLYKIRFTRSDSPTRVHRMTVVASSAEEARAYAQIRDPLFLATVPPGPRRGRAVVESRCRICGGELGEDATRIIEGGWACFRCREKADLPGDQEWIAHLDWAGHDIEVEVV